MYFWHGVDVPLRLTGLARVLQDQLVTESRGPGLGRDFFKSICLPAVIPMVLSLAAGV